MYELISLHLGTHPMLTDIIAHERTVIRFPGMFATDLLRQGRGDSRTRLGAKTVLGIAADNMDLLKDEFVLQNLIIWLPHHFHNFDQ